MTIRKDPQQPRIGMNRNSHPSELKEGEYSFALNANNQEEHGEGQIMLQNETSNTLCSKFLDGYVVVFAKYDRVREKTYFFLNNPVTGCSEIGSIPVVYDVIDNEVVSTVCGCSYKVVLEEGLENYEQVATCEYTTIISDYCELTGGCTGCLGFDPNKPIRDVVIRHAELGDEIYFTDGVNPQRYVKLDKIDSYFVNIDPCSGETEETCLKCDEMRVFKLHDTPCLNPKVIQGGGSLKAGMYEVLIASSDINGTLLTDPVAVVNPVSIFDASNTILDQTSLDYQTNQAFSVTVSNLDTEYEFYQVILIYSSGVDPAPQYYRYQVKSTDDLEIVVTNIPDMSIRDIDVNTILRVRPTYETAEGMVEAGGYLFQHGLTTKREINLQPVVNLMGAFANWMTYRAPEKLYANGIASSKWKSRMRDEVYPEGIQFGFKGGWKSALFPLISRPSVPFDVEVIDNLNTQSIKALGSDKCYGDIRDKRWQFENTATVVGTCINDGDLTEQEYTEEVLCQADGHAVYDGFIPTDTSETLVQWINNHTSLILTSTEDWALPLKDALTNNTYYDVCNIDGSCDDKPELLTSKVIAVGSEGADVVSTSVPYSQYQQSIPPTTCDSIEKNEEGISQQDTDVESALPAGSVVYKKVLNTNIDCITSTPSSNFTGSTPTTGYHLVDMASIGSNAPLLTTTSVSLFNGIDFKDTLHKNAIWFKVDFQALQYVAVELSNVICSSIDDNTNNKVRITVWEGCPTMIEDTSKARYVNDITTLNDEERFIFLDKSNYASTTSTIYIAVDSPMRSDTLIEFSLTDVSTNTNIEINSIPYLLNTAPNEATAVADFIINNYASGLANGVIFTDVVGKLQARFTEGWGIGGDYIGTYHSVESYYTLQPPCGCFGVVKREVILTNVLKYDSVTFAKEYTYLISCTRLVPFVSSDCEPTPDTYGKFGYVESTFKYPCNEELYDSSTLKIEVGTVPLSIQQDFEDYFVSTTLGGYYVLNSDTDFRDKPIRHFKYPDNKVSPFMNNSAVPVASNSSIIYPIGFHLSNEVINFFLDVAVTNNLITAEERSQVETYEIFRGDRATERSVIAKGVGFSTLKYIENSKQVNYPNYPLNDLNVDLLNGLSIIDTDFLTFHSPDTLFNKPTLPSEITIDGFQLGSSTNTFAPLLRHPTLTVLGRKARNLASTLAGIEVTFEMLIQGFDWTVAGSSGGVSVIVGVAAAAAAIVASVVASLFKAGEYRLQWLETFEGLGQGYNHAYIALSEANYNNFQINTVSTNMYRGLPIRTYLRPGLVEVRDEQSTSFHNINNFQREDSVLMKLGTPYTFTYPSNLLNYDNTRINIEYNETGIFSEYGKKSSVPYISLRQYLPGQWNDIGSISWLPTNYCGRLDVDNSCEGVFGGDIFISRFAIKRKFPFFTETAFGLAPNTPYKYSSYFNINKNVKLFRGYLDYKTANDSFTAGTVIFPENKSAYRLFNSGGENTEHINDFFVSDEYKFLTYYFGIPSFLVESEINCNYRYGRPAHKEDFYPNVGNTIDWVQEDRVSINEHERFHYNHVYSKRPHKKAYRLLPNDYNQVDADKQSNLDNAVIYSQRDNITNSRRSPWLNYHALDYHKFSNSMGKLVDLSAIESEQLWVRFTDGYSILGSVDPIRDKVAGNLGIGGIFQERAISFNSTDLGYGGTQHKTKLSTPFGHFSVDAKRGKVFCLSPNAQGMEEVSFVMDKWFKEQLPFKILKYIPNANIDNNYNGVGISMGWDDRFKRAFITKIDYIPVNKGQTFYDEQSGEYYIEINDEQIIVDITDETYFEKAHWTIAYSPLTKNWISYYSFTPNYYLGYNDYFQTGINNLNSSEHGLWSHSAFLSSYQVFYGKLYPFIIEYGSSTKLARSMLNSVSFWLDVRKYYNRYDFTNGFAQGFNKAYIYNDFQNSGLLDLNFQQNNDRRQLRDYPRFNTNSTSILQSEIQGLWSFNYLYNSVINERSGIPIWLSDNVQVNKITNDILLTFNGKRRDRLVGDYFLNRLIKDNDSRFKLLFKSAITERNYKQ